MYMVEMSERNAIPLEEINMIGHQFTTDFHPPPTPEELAMQQQLAEQMKKQFENSWNGQGGQGFNGQGGQGFNGQGGQGFGGQGFNGGYNGGFNGGFNGGNGGQGGFNGGNPYVPHNEISHTNNGLNPYSSGKSEINVGPTFHMAGTVKPAPKA